MLAINTRFLATAIFLGHIVRSIFAAVCPTLDGQPKSRQSSRFLGSAIPYLLRPTHSPKAVRLPSSTIAFHILALQNASETCLNCWLNGQGMFATFLTVYSEAQCRQPIYCLNNYQCNSVLDRYSWSQPVSMYLHFIPDDKPIAALFFSSLRVYGYRCTRRLADYWPADISGTCNFGFIQHPAWDSPLRAVLSSIPIILWNSWYYTVLLRS